MKKKIQNALISVFYKDGLAPVLEKLSALGIDIYSTGGTYNFIKDCGVDLHVLKMVLVKLKPRSNKLCFSVDSDHFSVLLNKCGGFDLDSAAISNVHESLEQYKKDFLRLFKDSKKKNRRKISTERLLIWY